LIVSPEVSTQDSAAAAAVSPVRLPQAVSAPAPRITRPAVASARRVRIERGVWLARAVFPEEMEVEFTWLT
jgi:hypothetical protein